VLERLMNELFSAGANASEFNARRGRLKLGCERSNVSILCATFALYHHGGHMDTDDLADRCSTSIRRDVECVFRNEGTIDKFIGDALLRFGSPEAHPPPEQAAKPRCHAGRYTAR